MHSQSDQDVCYKATGNKGWYKGEFGKMFVNEAKRRNLTLSECIKTWMQKLTSNKVCYFAEQQGLEIYVSEVKRRNLECGVNKEKQKTINSNSPNNKISNKTKDTEDKCTEIGFKKGTEKYGDCVLKMIELK